MTAFGTCLQSLPVSCIHLAACREGTWHYRLTERPLQPPYKATQVPRFGTPRQASACSNSKFQKVSYLLHSGVQHTPTTENKSLPAQWKESFSSGTRRRGLCELALARGPTE